MILGPKHPSRYGKLRREPRGDGLSTIEAAGDAAVEPWKKRPDIAETLHASFERMLAKYREAQSVMPELAAQAAGRKRDYRRRKPRITCQAALSGMTFLRIVFPLYLFVLSMIFSENRYTLFRIML